MHIRGMDPNTGQDIDHWGCAVGWMPTLLIENSQQQRQTGAAVESFRNETVRESQKNRTMYEDMMKQQQSCQFKSIHLKTFWISSDESDSNN